MDQNRQGPTQVFQGLGSQQQVQRGARNKRRQGCQLSERSRTHQVNLCKLGDRMYPFYTFIPRLGLTKKDKMSFEVSGKPGYYLARSKDDASFLNGQKISGGDAFRRAATWTLEKTEDVHTKGTWKLVYGNNNAVP